MNNLDDLELLREFAKSRSEEHFSKLINRYAPMVYSVGIRLAGSPEAARDITQSVFIDLVQGVSRVITSMEAETGEAGRGSLVGWLHRAARYEALEFIRKENRRQTRERRAMELQENSPADETQWNLVRPVLDEALDALDETDRRAVLLRYFQEASYREVGASFGISEDTAQKRVSRALDRLREILVRKGIAISGAGLSAGLSQGAIEKVPVDLAKTVFAGLREGARPMRRSACGRQSPFVPSRLTLTVAIAFMGVLALLWFANRGRPPEPPTASAVKVEDEKAAQGGRSSTLAVDNGSSSVATATALETELGLRVVAADTGLPLPGVLGVVTVTKDGTRAWTIATFNTDADGNARVAYTNDIFGMTIDLSLDGFASTRLSWKPGRGQAIPEQYNLRLATAPRIGGVVLDEQGAPVSDAWVQFHLPEKFDGPIAHPESFFCAFRPRVLTDEHGRFETKRLSREILPELQLAPSHEGFLSHDWLGVSSVTNGIEQLLARSFVLVLKRGLEVRGRVVDEREAAAAGIRVTFGSYHSNQRSSTSSVSGEFVLKGCTAGTNIITAFDMRRGAGFQIINASTNLEQCVLRLEPFRTLHVQTVDRTGAGVPNVEVEWQSVDQTGKTFNGFPGTPTAQYSFRGTTDHHGELIWTYAPAEQVLVSFYPKNHGQRHNLLLNADGLIQIVTLEENYPAQVIQGTVRDSLTRAPIPAVRVRKGYPRIRNGTVTPVWGSSYRDIVDFAGGNYKWEFDYSVDEPPSRFEYIFEFSAEGYAPAISRVVRGDEGNVDLDVYLKGGTTGRER